MGVTTAPALGPAASGPLGTTGLTVSRLDDALGILRWAPLPEVRPAYEAIRRLRPPRP